MTTHQPIVPEIPPFRGGPLQNRNATNVPQQHHHRSSNCKPSAATSSRSQQHRAQQEQQQQPQQQNPQQQNRPSTRLEREKKKNYDDPDFVGHWKLGKLIGQGASGRVRLATHKQTQVQAAVKIIPRAILASSRMDMRELGAKQEKMSLGIEREIVIMKLIEHPNLLGLWDVYETKKDLYIVMEYVAGGELFDHLVQQGRLTSAEARAYFRQIIFGVDYCHRFNICHRDLKPENLLLDASKRTVKVADFGMAALQPSEKMLETSCGSPHYASPEIVAGKSYKGAASDIWSCGIILFALLCGRLPFDDPNISRLLSKVKAGRFEMPPNLEPAAQNLIASMLQIDPERRLSMHEIMNHPWFTENGVQSNCNPVTTSFDALSGITPMDMNAEHAAELLKNLASLWPELGLSGIKRQLVSPGPNWQKTFYQLLLNHRENHSGDDEEDEDEEEEEEVGRQVGGLGLDLGMGSDAIPPHSRLERRSSSSKRDVPKPRRSVSTSRASSPNPPRREFGDQNNHRSIQQHQTIRSQTQNASHVNQYAHLVAHRAAPTSPGGHHHQQQQAAAEPPSTLVSNVNQTQQSSTTSTPTRVRSNTVSQATPPIASRAPITSSPYAGRASADTGRPTVAHLNAAAAGGISRPVSPLPPPSPNTQGSRGLSPNGPRRPSVSEAQGSSPAGSRVDGRQSLDQSRPTMKGSSSPSRPLPTPNQASNGTHTFSSPGTVASRVHAITYAQEVPRDSPLQRRESQKRDNKNQDAIPALVRRATSPSQKPQGSGAGAGNSTVKLTQATALQTRLGSHSRSSTSGYASGRTHGPLVIAPSNTKTSSSSNTTAPRPASRSSSRPASPSKGIRPSSIFGVGDASGASPSIQSPNLEAQSDPLFKDITDKLASMHRSGDEDGLETQLEMLRASHNSSSAGSAPISTNCRNVYGERSQPINVANGDAQFEDAEEEDLDDEYSGMDLDSMSLSSTNSASRNPSPYTPTSPLPPNLPNLGLALGISLNSSHNPTKPLALPDNKVLMVSRGGNGSVGMVRRHTDDVSAEREKSGVSIRSSTRSHVSTSYARNSVVGEAGPSSNGRPLSLFSTSSRQSSNSSSSAAPTLGRKRSLLGNGSRRKISNSENDSPMTTGIRYEQTQQGVKPISGGVSRPSSPVKSGLELKASSSPIADHARERAHAKPTRLQMKNPGLGLDISSHSAIAPGPASAPINPNYYRNSNVSASSSPRSPNSNFSQGALQTPSTIHSQLASPALSITSSSASSSTSNPPPSPQPIAKGFFGTLTSGLFKWSPASSLLYSTENLSITSDETRRIMKKVGFSVDNGSFGVIRCESTMPNSPKLKIRVNLVSLAVSNSSNHPSPVFGGHQSPALSSNSSTAGSAAGRSTNSSSGSKTSLRNYSTSVTFTLEGSGKKSHFEQVAAQIRNLWCLDSSPTAQSHNNEIVGLGVH